MSEEEKKELRRLCADPQCRVNDKIHIATIEKLTGYSYAKIYGFIKNDPFLHAQLAEAVVGDLVPSNTDLIDGDRDPMPAGTNFTREQWDEYQKLLRQQRKMHTKDWESLGVDPKDAEKMEHYGRLGSAPMSGILKLFGGQLISNANILDNILKGTAEKILTNQLPPENDRDGAPRDPGDVQRDWQYAFFAGVKLQLEITSHVHKIQALAARVMADMMKNNGGQKPESKGHYRGRDE